MRAAARSWLAWLLVGAAAPGWTHDAGSADGGTWWTLPAGAPEPWVAVLLALGGGAYAIGLVRLWRRAGKGRGIRRAQALAFAAGWALLVASLTSSVDRLSHALFWVHMVQHETMMVLAAPLLVMGRPLAAWAWSVPAHGRASLHRWLSQPAVALPWRALTRPLAAWALHAVAIWAWHAPGLFRAALEQPWAHAAQHASFLFSALLFWWSVLQAGSPGSARAGSALLALFTTMVHTAALGALLTMGPAPWYAASAGQGQAMGWEPLADQQLGGVVMWVPGGAAYLLAALWVGARLLAAPGLPRRQQAAELKPAPGTGAQ